MKGVLGLLSFVLWINPTLGLSETDEPGIVKGNRNWDSHTDLAYLSQVYDIVSTDLYGFSIHIWHRNAQGDVAASGLRNDRVVKFHWSWVTRSMSSTEIEKEKELYGYIPPDLGARLFVTEPDLHTLVASIEKYYKWREKADEINLDPEGKVITEFETNLDFSPLADPQPKKRKIEVIYSEAALVILPVVKPNETLFSNQYISTVGHEGRNIEPLVVPIDNGCLAKFYAVIQPDNVARVRKSMNDFVDGKRLAEDEAREKEVKRQRRIDAEFK